MSNYTNLILRTLTSLYGDITRGGVLSWNDVDQNFLYLKGNLIYSSTTLGNTIYLQKYNGETISFLGGSGGTSNDTYWTSGSTGNYSLKANNDSSLDALGNYSLAEGWNTTAIAENSHAEGGYTIAGWRGFNVYNYSGGTVNISGYGDLTSSFNASTLYDENGSKTPYSGTTWESPYFKIKLTDSPATYNGNYVADVNNLYDPLADNLLGDNNHVEGYNSKSIGYTSHAEGYNTTSFGHYSHSEGRNTSAFGETSHAEGFYSKAIGMTSHAEGRYTESFGEASHTEGRSTIAGWRGFTVSNYSAGTVTITGYGDLTNSFYPNIGSGILFDNDDFKTPYSGTAWNDPDFKINLTNSPITYNALYVADINNLNASLADQLLGGYASHSEGVKSRAIGDGSHAEGGYYDSNTNTYYDGGQAIGISSHAEGVFTTAYGFVSHAEGSGTTAIGQFSHSSGYDTTAIGDQSHSEGKETTSGWKGFAVSTVIDGVVILNGYGDLTNSFYPNIGSGILFDNNAFKTPYSGTSWDGTDFKINLTNSPITYNALYVADIDNLYDYYANNLLGDNSHAEGTKTSSFGYASHAEGEETTSIGDSSHAEGQTTISIGVGSHAEGGATTSYGIRSHAEGTYTTSIGYDSHSEGLLTTAIGNGSHAEGSQTTASGSSSHAEGGYYDEFTGIYYSGGTSMGNGSHAEGIKTTSVGIGSHSEGYQTIAGWKGFQVYNYSAGTVYITGYGNLTSSFAYYDSFLLDELNNLTPHSGHSWNPPYFQIFLTNSPATYAASIVADIYNLSSTLADQLVGERSHAEGYKSTAAGIASHAEGGYFDVGTYSADGGIAIGHGSHAEGGDTTSIGDGSHAEGVLTTSIGYSSHAEGIKTTAYGNASHSEGGYFDYGTYARGGTAIGGGSHAEGIKTTSIGIGSHAEGGYFDVGTYAYYSGGTAIGNASHAEGIKTTSVGIGSHSEGLETTAYGDYSFVHGTGSTASASTSIVLGNNITGTTSNTVYVSNLNIKTLGGGTSVNNLGIDSNGNVVIGSSGGTSNTNITGFTYTSSTNTIYLGQTDQLEKSIYIDKMSGLTVNGNLTFTGQSNNPIYSAGTLTSTYIPNWNNSNIQTFTLSATTSISGGTNTKNGAIYTIILKQDGSGNRTVNWGTPYRWQSGIAPVLTSTANAVDILTFISDGTNLYGLIAKNFI